MKLWSGRFLKSTAQEVDEFNSSIGFDSRLYRYDIEGSIAHVQMLSKQKIIPSEDAELIADTLRQILVDIETGKVEFRVDLEDIHMNIEHILIERIGEVGKKVHTARSRNDQVALDLRMYLRDEVVFVKQEISKLQGVLLKIAEQNLSTIMPGYTHLQRAQPITFAHHLSAYVEMLSRDQDRLSDCLVRLNVMPLGAGALAGTTYDTDLNYLSQKLGFNAVARNTLDAVSDRDFVCELAFCLAMLMVHVSRFSEEVILWSTQEFNFVVLDDAFSTGSSMMPQKKNPDIAELARGKSARTFGNLLTLLTVMKGLPLAYNKDMQEDKEHIFDSLDTVKKCLRVFTGMIDTMKINKSVMLESAKSGFLNATDVADYLVKKGVPFREAHQIVGQMVFECIKCGKKIEDLSFKELKSFSDKFESDIISAISVEHCVNKRNTQGGPAPDVMLKYLKSLMASDF